MCSNFKVGLALFMFSLKVSVQYPIKNCLPIVEGDFAEYYEVRGNFSDLLSYRANINMSIQETFTENHFVGEKFRIIVDDQNPENVLILVKFPDKWRFYNFDDEDYFTRELSEVDYEHAFTFKGFLFYSPTNFMELKPNIVENSLTMVEIGQEQIDELAPEELEDIAQKCWNETDHCYGDGDQLMQEGMTDNFVVQMKEQLQIVATHNTNEFYIHDLVSKLDFCFPPTLKTHKDFETGADNKFAYVQSRFPIVRADSPFLQRRQEYVKAELDKVPKLSNKNQKMSI